MSAKFPPVPPNLKQLNHYLKVAIEHETRDPIISYWARFYAVQLGLTIDKSSPEAKTFLFSLLEWLEKRKKELNEDSINNESVAEAHIENYAVKIFTWADGQERNSVHNKNVVKAFYTAGILFDILSNFTKELSEDIEKMKKYAKWRAAYIHNCLKNGETPLVPADYDDDEGAQDILGPEQGPASASGHTGWNFPSQPPYQSQEPDPVSSSSGGVFPPSASSSQQPSSFPPASNNFAQPMDTTQSGVAYGEGTNLSPEKITRAQKYIKWAGSSLNFDDCPTAITNLKKALHLLTTGEELE